MGMANRASLSLLLFRLSPAHPWLLRPLSPSPLPPPPLLPSPPRLSPPRLLGPKPSEWNETIKAAWKRAWASVATEACSCEVEVEGTFPPSLQGTLFRNGPGNFERGGERFAHVLDGDGLLCKWTLHGPSSSCRFSRRFVHTPTFARELQADAVLSRSTFGTQPQGLWKNALRLSLKNPANTHVISLGERTLALWEGGLPSRVDPSSLSYLGRETFGGLLLDGDTAISTGLGRGVDEALGLGVGFSAHPREVGGRLVGWSWKAPILDSDLEIDIFEWEIASGKLLASSQARLPGKVAPHDFAVTANWYVYVLNGMALDPLPYVMGATGPVGALTTTGKGVSIVLLPRPDGEAKGSRGITIHTDDPYFAIHHATAFEEGREGGCDIQLYTAAWPNAEKGPFLGDWGGAVPLFDNGKIKPTQLLHSTIRIRGEEAFVDRPSPVADGACIDHPHCDPRFDGDSRARYLYMSYCNDEGDCGSPPVGWARWDRKTGEKQVWKQPGIAFCEEVVVIPRPSEGGEAAAEDRADAWLAGMMYDDQSARSCLAILDADRIEEGPVCRLWLKDHMPHGLHGSFNSKIFEPMDQK